MNFTPVFAEDIPPTVLVVFLVPLLLGVFALRGITAARRTGGSSSKGLIINLVAVAVGGVILFLLLTVRGGAPTSFIVVAAIPVVAGLLSLYVRGRKSQEAAQTTTIMFRIVIYSCFALAFIYLCFVLLKRP
jgi:hypothetical protein